MLKHLRRHQLLPRSHRRQIPNQSGHESRGRIWDRAEADDCELNSIHLIVSLTVPFAAVSIVVIVLRSSFEETFAPRDGLVVSAIED
jgi:hypothetical protein